MGTFTFTFYIPQITSKKCAVINLGNLFHSVVCGVEKRVLWGGMGILTLTLSAGVNQPWYKHY